MTTASLPAEAADNRRWFVLVLVCIAQFMVVLDATITNVALLESAPLLDVVAPPSSSIIFNAATFTARAPSASSFAPLSPLATGLDRASAPRRDGMG